MLRRSPVGWWDLLDIHGCRAVDGYTTGSATTRPSNKYR
jgi:hypothetical protein